MKLVTTELFEVRALFAHKNNTILRSVEACAYPCEGPTGNLSTCLSGVENRGSVRPPADVSGRLGDDVIEVLPRRHVPKPNVVCLYIK